MLTPSQQARINQAIVIATNVYNQCTSLRDKAEVAKAIRSCFGYNFPDLERFYEGEQVWFFTLDDPDDWDFCLGDVDDEDLEIKTGVVKDWTTRHPEYSVYASIETDEVDIIRGGKKRYWMCDEHSNNVFATEAEAKEALKLRLGLIKTKFSPEKLEERANLIAKSNQHILQMVDDHLCVKEQ